ncbi:snoaL-like domain protein [Mycobacterium kansasii 732]|uniref:SnoaL-like domain-containing protein n=1 Tax=Mycobacterium pseudokansasii TaxID=2341080 RepID=A0A498QZ63_9MYCO|nr:nuclear transport factor 2 family protein [Mycobacterium pseudokansasii]EUA07693.1 snoaL-like domain protein [Mycobacterium kansasii 732]KZS68366.1 hypothetical protein A4G27_09415 [Mycobacterium kansasii]MBY0389183.1 nuclear transport factor 2 family protein [Mycobacterium pseudokansasii]VBA30957.1 hypothetical protein LAUMK35_04904 [Mycobacterium pseudokansasii]VBA32907.1 hypothetical protein LAUMK21_04894 [Mycobacterium pseudokansasii]
MLDTTPVDGIDAREATFDAADRLAVINLLGAYAYLYDQDHLDEHRALFTESPELFLTQESNTVSADMDTVAYLAAARKAAFNAENNRRRHAIDSVWFTSQNATEASGHCYVQVSAIRDGGPPIADLTACYDFTAVKQHGVWRFSRWVLGIDQSNT